MRIIKRLSILFVVLICIFTLSISASAANEKVIIRDNAEFLSKSETSTLQAQMEALSEKTGWCIEIVSTTEDLTHGQIIYYAEEQFDTDFGINTDGILYWMDSANGNYMLHFLAANNAKKIMPETYLSVVYERAKVPFEAYDEYESAQIWLGMSEAAYNHTHSIENTGALAVYYSYYTASRAKYALIGLGIGALITLIAGISVYTRYHKHPKISASAYLNRSTVNLYRKNDRFIREYTTRTVHSSSSGSSRGGGSHGGGHHGGGGGGGRR